VFLDATYSKARVNQRVVSRAVVIATGVPVDGRRPVTMEVRPALAPLVRAAGSSAHNGRDLALASGSVPVGGRAGGFHEPENDPRVRSFRLLYRRVESDD
jgi:hypothetical protein